MKTLTKLLAVLLAVFFCVSALAVFGSAAGTAGSLQKGDTFQFGFYPQKEVTNQATLAMLAKRSGFRPVVTDSAKYYALCMERELGAGDYIFSPVYGYSADETYWFECEPIQWRVMDKTDKGVLLMATEVLDVRAFNSPIGTNNTWMTSSVRSWLNKSFYNTAFSAAEKACILDTYNKNEVNHPIIKGDSGEDTTDRVFLPSFNDITNPDYGFLPTCDGVTYGDHGETVNYYAFDPLRKATSTDYAKCRGVWTNTVGPDSYQMPANEFCRYWLRSAGQDVSAAGKHNNFTAGVLEDGRVSTGWESNHSNVGIRPMIWVSLDAVYARDPFVPDTIDFTMPEYVHYYEAYVRPITEDDVNWSSSDPSIVSISEDGNLIIHGVGTVTITASLKDDPGVSVSKELTVTYAWWEQLIRIFLFGWIWY